MSRQTSRLLELIEYVQQTAQLGSRLVTDIKAYQPNTWREDDFTDLPGIELNQVDTQVDAEVWLEVRRLRETTAPAPDSDLVRLWLQRSDDPGTVPRLKESLSVSTLRLHPESFALPEGLLDSEQQLLVNLAERAQVLAAFEQYREKKWVPWAREEVKTRKTISLYSRLFALQQQLEMGTGEKPLELLWGVGMALVHRPARGIDICHPLLVRGVELSINSDTLALEVRPRDVQAKVELRCFPETEFPGVLEVEKSARSIYTPDGENFSPFERATFAPLLQVAVAQLDARGSYLPDRVKASNRLLPAAGEDLQVTDTWVLFARPRGVGLLTEDLERFKARLNSEPFGQLPAAVRALVTEPAAEQKAPAALFPYRGLSLVSGQTHGKEAASVQELYFPLPFNDEQVQIIQRLDVHDGVVVQGPPGTGKTHTIANIICHYMALGKRVLVTSLKDQALAVIQEKLPAEIRKLSVSLLTSEAEGMKQFATAITTLAAGIQSTDRGGAELEIARFTDDLNRLHAAIARIDRELADWAARNTEPITIHGKTLLPLEAAEEVIAGAGLYEWFPDKLTLDPCHDPRFTENEIGKLREARRVLGADLDYLSATLPSHAKLPDPARIGQLHVEIKQLRELLADTESMGLPSWALQMSSDEEGLRSLHQVLLSLQDEQARLLVGSEWVRKWLAQTQVNDSKYQTTVQPKIQALPDGQQLAQLHRNLIQHQELTAELAASKVAALNQEGRASAEELQRVASDLADLQTSKARLAGGARWIEALLTRFRSGEQTSEYGILADLGRDLAMAQSGSETFLRRPIQGAEGFLPGSELLKALDNLVADKPPFGLIGQLVSFNKKKEKAQIDSVRILVSPPATAQDWAHVRAYVTFQQHVQELVFRWQVLAPRLGLPPADDFAALTLAFGRYREMEAYVEQEKSVRSRLCAALPGWSADISLDDDKVLTEAILVAGKHLARLALRDAGPARAAALAALDGTDGNISRALRILLHDHLGNPASDEGTLQNTWSSLLAELQRAQVEEAAHEARETAARELLVSAFPLWSDTLVLSSPDLVTEAIRVVRRHLYAATVTAADAIAMALRGADGRVSGLLRSFIANELGNEAWDESEVMSQWADLLMELQRVEALSGDLETVNHATRLIARCGAAIWADWLRISPRQDDATEDELIPMHWLKAWRLQRLAHFVEEIDARAAVRELTKQRQAATTDLARTYQRLIAARTWHRLAENATPAVRSALQAFLAAMSRIGKTGRGKKANAARGEARQAADLAQPAIPCWILPHYRVSEALPTEFGSFDLVIIDEASQSDLSALPALLRARKLLVVGDDKQVSPAAVGMNVDEVQNLMLRTLPNAVPVFKSFFSPDRSIYDLCKVVFADTTLMLREHFRCVAPIIEYSKRQFYNHELRPLRYPKASERLDPPLVDVLVVDGFRERDINPSEAKFIVEEITRITQNPQMVNRTIGVISLTQNKQAYYIWEQLQRTLSPEVILRHRIACGDAATFQGNERDIVFLSMLVSKGQAHALSGKMYEQRFNVAASRARDRLYLVRSMEFGELSPNDLRRSLVAHFQAPFQQEEAGQVADRRSLCESDFERDMFDELVARGYRVRPQVRVGSYRIDMVVEGDNDERLAIECDGDRYHGPEQWEADMRRQRILERAGWQFWRCFASTYVRYREDVLLSLERALQGRGITPVSAEDVLVESDFVEFRRVEAFEQITRKDLQAEFKF